MNRKRIQSGSHNLIHLFLSHWLFALLRICCNFQFAELFAEGWCGFHRAWSHIIDDTAICVSSCHGRVWTFLGIIGVHSRAHFRNLSRSTFLSCGWCTDLIWCLDSRDTSTSGWWTWFLCVIVWLRQPLDLKKGCMGYLCRLFPYALTLLLLNWSVLLVWSGPSSDYLLLFDFSKVRYGRTERLPFASSASSSFSNHPLALTLPVYWLYLISGQGTPFLSLLEFDQFWDVGILSWVFNLLLGPWLWTPLSYDLL